MIICGFSETTQIPILLRIVFEKKSIWLVINHCPDCKFNKL